MLFSKDTYVARRQALRQRVGDGLILMMGNNDASYNYPANVYQPRQDSNFLYFTGQERDGLALVIDCDAATETLFGNDIDIEDIVWMGFTPSVADLAAETGIGASAPMGALAEVVKKALQQGRRVHYAPMYRYDLMVQLMDMTGIHPSQNREKASLDLIRAIVDMRAVKSDAEIAEIERACTIGYVMHTTAMRLCRPGRTEAEVAGIINGIASSDGHYVSFPSILTMHGEIQHGCPSLRPMEAGRLMLCDAGAESFGHYASDNTRTSPISGKYTPRQLDVYNTVLRAHDRVIEIARPGVKWFDVHMEAARVITEGLKDIGLMKGNTEDAVAAGAHAMFFPHGLGHMMGMDVHDMEGLGQIYVGFDDEVRPSTQFGTNCLRCGRRLQQGWVMTDEPGIYFIPALIDDWRGQGLHKEFINYDLAETYKDFGGIRLEDDLLITADGCRILGEQIPIKPEAVEFIVGTL
ncbi:MAG: aminopeptidase P family protein [Bacteroidaceae bacterium]|nr:aminopeptidase P family protein [Bacteroidaceae bacterium]